MEEYLGLSSRSPYYRHTGSYKVEERKESSEHKNVRFVEGDPEPGSRGSLRSYLGLGEVGERKESPEHKNLRSGEENPQSDDRYSLIRYLDPGQLERRIRRWSDPDKVEERKNSPERKNIRSVEENPEPDSRDSLRRSAGSGEAGGRAESPERRNVHPRHYFDPGQGEEERKQTIYSPSFEAESRHSLRRYAGPGEARERRESSEHKNVRSRFYLDQGQAEEREHPVYNPDSMRKIDGTEYSLDSESVDVREIKDIEYFIDFVRNTLKEDLRMRQVFQSKGEEEVSFNNLCNLFKIGPESYVAGYFENTLRAFQMVAFSGGGNRAIDGSINRRGERLDTRFERFVETARCEFHLVLLYLDFNGRSFCVVRKDVKIHPFLAKRPIRQLPVFPMHYLPELELEKLKERGTRFLEFAEKQAHGQGLHRYYTGLSLNQFNGSREDVSFQVPLHLGCHHHLILKYYADRR